MTADVVRPGRLVGIDVARCLALLGMMAVHVVGKRTPEGDLSWAYAVAGGRASALFAVLAGVSLALMSGRTEPVRGGDRHRVAAALVVRAGLVALLGLVLGGLDSGVAVILTHYGLLFALAIPFLGLRAPALAALAGGWILATPVMTRWLLPALPEFDGRSPVLGDLAEPGRLLGEILLTGTYPALPWLAFVVAGMALGRVDLRQPRAWGRCAVGGAWLALVAFAVSRVFTAQSWVREDLGFGGLDHDGLLEVLAVGTGGTPPRDGSWSWLLVVAPHSATPFDLAHTIGCAVAVIGCCLAVAALGSVPLRAVAVLFGAGTMTLTLYSLHVVMLTGPVWPPEGPDAYVWHVLVALGLGALGVATGVRGPLESVVGAPARLLSRGVATRSPDRCP